MSQELIRQRIQDFRTSQGLSVSAWARKAGIAEGTLRNYLRGHTQSLRYETMEKLAAAFQMSVAEMLGEGNLPSEAAWQDTPGQVAAAKGWQVRETETAEQTTPKEGPPNIDHALIAQLFTDLIDIYRQENVPFDLDSVDQLRDDTLSAIRDEAQTHGEALDMIAATKVKLRQDLRRQKKSTASAE